MLIRPKFQTISSVSQLEQMKELKRNIVIYSKNTLDNSKCDIVIFNNSIQVGSIHGIQSKHEILYSVNCYFGEVESPLCISPSTGELTVNTEAIVRIKGYTYTTKLIDNFDVMYETFNSFDECFNGEACTYRNKNSEIENPTIPDPRFYNIDQQFVMTGGCTNAFCVTEGDYAKNLLLDIIMREGGGAGYRLGDLIDEYTTIRDMTVSVSDPFNLVSKYGEEFQYFMTTALATITNEAMLCFLDEYHVFIDHDLGCNATHLKRKFQVMEKKYENTELRQFFFNLTTLLEDMQNDEFRIRYTLIYKDFKTNVSVVPLDKDPYRGQVSFDDREVVDYIEDAYNSWTHPR
ncbi:MAG: hypothetical protein IJ772_04790 [Bacilli bacterium]|nr:hypothetical protein [Bacilli bacterium]